MLNKIKNRPPVCKTERRYTEKPLFVPQNEPLTPPQNHTTKSEAKQGVFANILLKGSENGLFTPELMRITGIHSSRIIRRMISEERAAGAVILSGETGYYLPDDGEKGRHEVEAFIATMTAKGHSTIQATQSAKRYLDNLPGQTEIGGYADGETQGG